MSLFSVSIICEINKYRNIHEFIFNIYNYSKYYLRNYHVLTSIGIIKQAVVFFYVDS